jgi:hypothetical protein
MDRVPERRRSLRCRLGFHDWYSRPARGGDKVAICKRCDKREFVGPWDDATTWVGWMSGAG